MMENARACLLCYLTLGAVVPEEPLAAAPGDGPSVVVLRDLVRDFAHARVEKSSSASVS